MEGFILLLAGYIPKILICYVVGLALNRLIKKFSSADTLPISLAISTFVIVGLATIGYQSDPRIDDLVLIDYAFIVGGVALIYGLTNLKKMF
jgi:hypothetical protein|tara:strand:+ start:58 stop:333 length:276 start_codon:yes stop_codon:yes gene_type:complete